VANEVSSKRTISTRRLKKSLERCVAVKRPAFIWGPPGIGKSDTIAQLCHEMGGYLYDIRLSLMEPTDLRGIPFYNKETGRMEWAPPIDLPDPELCSKYPIVFLFFDEMNSAGPAVQAACYQIALNRRIGTYKLPDNVVIVAAGNRDGDKGVTFRMPTPLANRFVHFELKVDFDSWEEWAVNRKLHRDVVGFISFSKDSLYDFKPQSNERAFATPRSWEFVSQLLEDTIDEVTMTDLISGTIGEGLALKFLAHRKVAARMPKPSAILDGTETELKVKEVSAQYSLAVSCCYEMKDTWEKVGRTKNEKVFHEGTNNFLSFIMDNFQTEVVVMAMRMALQVYKLPLDPKKIVKFDEFYTKFGKLIMKAS
jgi:hypothetical protein